jgi:hypothetical protein
MSFGAISGATGVDTTSALRFGLTGLKPIRVSEVIKRFGIKYKVTSISFAPNQNITSFEDYTKLSYQTIFNNILIPEYFDAQKLINFYSKMTIENFNKDKEFKEQMEKVKNSKSEIGPFIDFIKYVKERYQKDIHKMYEINVINFYASDMPFSIFNDFSRTDHIYANFINLLHHTLNSYNKKFLLRAKHDNKIFYKLFEEMKGELDTTFDLIEKMIFYEKCLQRMIIIWNANNYEELKNIEKVYYDRLPKEEFNTLYISFKNNIKFTRRNIMINKYYREDDTIDIKPPQMTYKSQDLLKSLFYENELRVPVWRPQ